MPFRFTGMAFLFYFEFMNVICLNGKMIPAGEPALMAANRGFRYGDALFETIKVINAKIILQQYHFDRLFAGLKLLQFEIPLLITRERLAHEVLDLCKKNECENLARVRLTVFRGDGGLYDENKNLQYLIECWPLIESINKLNENGLTIDVFPDARKSCDRFSNLKSANYLPYVMAALYTKENKLNDCLVLNVHGRICDATIANLFWIKDEIIFTPSLSEGCVSGVMRKYLVENLQEKRYKVQEQICAINDLQEANEIFLTNAINGIRWVKQLRSSTYYNQQTLKIYKDFFG